MPTCPTPNIKLYPDDAVHRTDRFASEMEIFDTAEAAYADWDAHMQRLEEMRRERRERALLEG